MKVLNLKLQQNDFSESNNKTPVKRKPKYNYMNSLDRVENARETKQCDLKKEKQ